MPPKVNTADANRAPNPGELDGATAGEFSEVFYLDVKNKETCHALPRRRETDKPASISKPALMKQRKKLKQSDLKEWKKEWKNCQKSLMSEEAETKSRAAG